MDSVLSGVSLVDDPSRVKDSDWSITPKDYTLYGIKFINKYHGYYLRRGVDEMANDTGLVVRTVYRNEYVERDVRYSAKSGYRTDLRLFGWSRSPDV